MHLNPADNAFKGMLANDLKWRAFYDGPDFIWKSKDGWSARQVVNRPFPARVLAASAEPKPALPASWVLRVTNKVSTWRRKLRRVALLKRVILVCIVRRQRPALFGGAGRLAAPLGVELADAEKLVISAVQRRPFYAECPWR